MEFLKLRSYAFLSQASYRGLSTLRQGAAAGEVERLLIDSSADAISKDNQFAVAQAKLLSGSNTKDTSDGFTFIDQRPNTPTTGFSGTVFQLAG